MSDTYDLRRFVEAQEPVFEQALAELRAGRKRSHWMWFVFPQLKGLGSSAMAERYGISSRAEAEAYLAHPILGARLRKCAQVVNEIAGASSEEIFGYPDHLKFRSSMTLFARAAPDDTVFQQALDRYFEGRPDSATLDLLARAG